MSAGVYAWSQTQATNATSSTAINLRDNQAPSVVKTNGREIMAEIAKWRDDLNGTLTTGGSGTAYTLSSNQNITAESGVPDGFEIAAIIHAASGSAPTLAVDGQTAYPITYKTGFAPPSGMLEAKSIQRFRFVSADSEWRLMHVTARDTNQPGAEITYYGSTLPGGYVWANGQTIGNGSSSATQRANADCAALFSALWSAYANTELPIQDSSGSASTRGASAAADFAANKRLPVPDRRDRASVGKGTMGGTSAAGLIVNTAPVSIDTSTLGKTGGADRVTLDTTMIPSHSHGVNDPGHHHSFTADQGTANRTGTDSACGGTPATTNTANATTGISINNTGGGGAHSNMIPVIVCNVIIKL